jgi:hypothetical protein
VEGQEQMQIENQELFRLANERFHARVRNIDLDGSSLPFFCECADGGCLGRVELTHEDYEGIRSQPNRYVILPGHAMIEAERVVQDNGHFHVVEKEHHGSE